MVLSWYSWNWPLTKRSTKLDFPTADSPNRTSLNWQILLLAAVPLVRAGPPRPAIAQCWKLGGISKVKEEEVWLNLSPGFGAGLDEAERDEGPIQFRQLDEPETSQVGAGKHNMFNMLNFPPDRKQAFHQSFLLVIKPEDVFNQGTKTRLFPF